MVPYAEVYPLYIHVEDGIRLQRALDREKNQEKLELELRKERYEDAIFGLVLFVFLTLAVLLIYCATSIS